MKTAATFIACNANALWYNNGKALCYNKILYQKPNHKITVPQWINVVFIFFKMMLGQICCMYPSPISQSAIEWTIQVHDETAGRLSILPPAKRNTVFRQGSWMHTQKYSPQYHCKNAHASNDSLFHSRIMLAVCHLCPLIDMHSSRLNLSNFTQHRLFCIQGFMNIFGGAARQQSSHHR